MRHVERNGVEYYLVNCDCVEVTRGGELLGTISINPGDWEEIENGADPISDGWEDGIGNIVCAEGWGEQ